MIFSPEQDQQLEVPLTAENLGETMGILASVLTEQLPDLVVSHESETDEDVTMYAIKLEGQGGVTGMMVSALSPKDFYKIGAGENAREIDDQNELWIVASIPLLSSRNEGGADSEQEMTFKAMTELFREKLFEMADIYEPILINEDKYLMISLAFTSPARSYDGKLLVIELVDMLRFLGEEGGAFAIMEECKTEFGYTE